MEKRLIARGLLAGAVGAVLAFLFGRVCAEPVIARAIAFEDGRTDALDAHGVHEHGAELFTRGVQANAGLGFGVLIFGLAMGALFSVLFCVVSWRATGVGPRALSALLAAGAFVAVYLVPFLKYPPNPPAVGQADTIGARTGWYLVMVLASVALAIAAVWLARRLAWSPGPPTCSRSPRWRWLYLSSTRRRHRCATRRARSSIPAFPPMCSTNSDYFRLARSWCCGRPSG